MGPVIDTVDLARLLMPSEESFTKNHLATRLDLDHNRPHQVDCDAEVTAKIFIYLIEKLKSLPLLTLQKLNR
ncbi:hypothetical protein KHA80_01225 [Anaerobacillus sp. HL2]|nr:hypothetical protein KHA80_01225 [Anaerobacillus sp. HL2]